MRREALAPQKTVNRRPIYMTKMIERLRGCRRIRIPGQHHLAPTSHWKFSWRKIGCPGLIFPERRTHGSRRVAERRAWLKTKHPSTGCRSRFRGGSLKKLGYGFGSVKRARYK